MTFTDECKFCMKYLIDHVQRDNFQELERESESFNVSYTLVRNQDNYWTDIAKALCEIWPKGSKGGKYPWAGNPKEIAKRLELMWKTKIPDKSYTKEQILSVSRKYVAQFEDDTKYMRTLKYFILKQDKVLEQNGRFRIINSSLLCDMLENSEFNSFMPDDASVSAEIFSEWEGEIV